VLIARFVSLVNSGVTMGKRSRTAEWIKQKTKKSQEILIKEAKKQGRTLRKEEKSKDKTEAFNIPFILCRHHPYSPLLLLVFLSLTSFFFPFPSFSV
jgi:hypothetical protein